MKAIIIDMDEIKKTFPGYSDKKPEKFHEESSKLSKEAFSAALSFSKYSKVLLMAGGSCSGKTEFISSELVDKEVIIFDGTLGSIGSTDKKIKEIIKNGKQVEVCAIIPESISDTFNAFLLRSRRVPEKVFFETHSGFRNTLKWLLKNRPEVIIRIIMNRGEKDGALIVEELTFKDEKSIEDFILTQQMTEDDIQDRIRGQL